MVAKRVTYFLNKWLKWTVFALKKKAEKKNRIKNIENDIQNVFCTAKQEKKENKYIEDKNKFDIIL